MMRSGTLVVLLGLLMAPMVHAAPAPQKVILDTDGDADYDDVVALMVAAASPELQILGVVATGRDAERRGRTIAKALHIMGRDDIGIYLGEPPTSPEPAFAYFSQFPRRLYGMRPEIDKWAADYRYTPQKMSGVEFYLQQVAVAPGEISVVVTGPLSTLGRAMQVADERGSGQAFRRGIRQVPFSGGDFSTVEYNVYTDVGAARLLFSSGIPIYQFGGEGEGKAYLQHADRMRLWQAQTPATWALQDLYRLYHAGWDPTSPFVPILYDVHPLALLIEGETISRFEPAAVEVDKDGRLVRGTGAPNANVRVANAGDKMVEFFVGRMTDPVPAASNHLRAIAELAGAANHTLSGSVANALEQLNGHGPPDRAVLAAVFDRIQPQLSSLGERAERARWHLEMARGFVAGEPRTGVWTDRYTPTFITLFLVPFEVLGFFLAHKIVGVAVFLLAAAVAAMLVLGWWRARQRRRPRAAAAVVR